MRKSFSQKLIVVLLAVLLSWVGHGFAADAAATSSAANPVQLAFTAEPETSYTDVKGDASKFRALHWEPQGYVAGLRDFTASGDLGDGVSLESEGSVVPESGDYKGMFRLTKEDIGYISFDYNQFRKYYSNAGGLYKLFPLLASNYTDKELALNLGHFGVEAGLTLKYLPEIVLNYEREFKEGTKSRLAWSTVFDAAGNQKKISPTWQNIDEITDSFNVKLSDAVKGFNWKADQHWEYTRGRDIYESRTLSSEAGLAATSNHTASTDTYHQPRTDIIATTFGLDRWFMKEKVYVSSGYRFSQVDSRTLLDVFNYKNIDGSPLGSGSNTIDSPSDNHYVSQTWVSSIMTTLFNPFTAIVRSKIETVHRYSASTLSTQAVTAPFAVTNIESDNQQKIMRYGESVSFRYSGIPWAAIYNDYDLEQTDDTISKNRQATAGSNDTFRILNIDRINRWSGTLGAQVVPCNHVTMTIQGRHRVEDNQYDPTAYVSGETASALQTWNKEQKILTEEASARISWKPVRWFQPSFRYQLQDKHFKNFSYPDPDVPVDTAQISSTYTSELVSQPMDDLLLTASFSFQDGKVITPDRFTGLPESVPTFNFDSYNSLFSAEYSLTKDLVLTVTADYIRAANFQDFSAIGLPLGADFHQADLTLGCRWQAKKDLTIEPKYAWYQYRAGGSDVGSYNAQTILLEAKMKW